MSILRSSVSFAFVLVLFVAGGCNSPAMQSVGQALGLSRQPAVAITTPVGQFDQDDLVAAGVAAKRLSKTGSSEVDRMLDVAYPVTDSKSYTVLDQRERSIPTVDQWFYNPGNDLYILRRTTYKTNGIDVASDKLVQTTAEMPEGILDVNHVENMRELAGRDHLQADIPLITRGG